MDKLSIFSYIVNAFIAFFIGAVSVVAFHAGGWNLPDLLPIIQIESLLTIRGLLAAAIFCFVCGLFARNILNQLCGKKCKSGPDLTSRRQRAFRAKTFPAGYPNGWYKVSNSSDLLPGQVKYVQVLGQHLVLFRGKNNGQAAVLDAFCPHLGANMAVGGKVQGDCIQCPFHEWSFSGDGAVAKVPYYDGTLPKNASAKSWPVEERYGMIMMWFDAEGRAPAYYLPKIPNIESGEMTYRGKHPGRSTLMHIQDFSENGVDFAHFNVLHSTMHIPWTSIALPFIKIRHDGKYTIDEDQPHISYFDNDAVLRVFGREIGRTKAHAKIHFIGPCGIVYLQFTIPDLGDIMLFECHTPEEPVKLKTDFMWYADKKVPTAIAWYVVGSWYAQWHNDLEVWENKIYRRPPIVLKTDGPVAKFRRWYAQFYSEHSEEVSKDSLDW